MLMDIEPVNIVYFYNSQSSKDQRLRDVLDMHICKIAHVTTKNYDDSLPGKAREKNIKSTLASAHILLLLESADFQASDDYSKLMGMVSDMYAECDIYSEHKIHILPVMLRPTNREDMYFRDLQPLPHNVLPITKWKNQDEAFLDVRTGVNKVVDIINAHRKRDLHLKNAAQHDAGERYTEALEEYEFVVLSLFLNKPYADEESTQRRSTDIWRKIAAIHCKRGKFLEALDAYQKVVDNDPHDVETFIAMANLHMQLFDFIQATDVCTMAILSNPQVARLYILKSVFLWYMGQSEHALAACNDGISICLDKAAVRRQKGKLLYKSERYAEACGEYEAALCDDPDNTYLHSEYGDALLEDRRFRGAEKAYQSAVDIYDRGERSDPVHVDKLEERLSKAQREAARERIKNRELKNKPKPLK